MATQAYKYNGNTDDPIMSDGSSHWTGVVSATKPNRLEQSELADLLNGDIGAYGTVKTRPPAKLIGKNLTDEFYVDHNGVAYEDYFGLRLVREGYISDTQKIWVFNGESPKIFFFVEGNLYIGNGLDFDSWGDPKLTDLPKTNEISATQLADIAYFVNENKLHYWTNDTFGTVDNFKKVSEDGSTLVDGISIPPATCIETHVERLCMAGIKDDAHNPATIFFSDYLDGKTWSITESVQVGSDGDAIIGLKSWRNNTLLVFKSSSVWAVICSPLIDDDGNKLSPAYWTINKISDSYGVVSRETIAQVGNDVWFLSKRGVCSIQRAVASEDNEMQALPISTPIQNYIDRINWNYAYTASAVYFKDRYFLSIPIDNSTRPNIVLIYNTITQKWQGIWEGSAMRATGYARINIAGVERAIWRTHDGTAYQFLDDDIDSAYDICEGYKEYYKTTTTTKSFIWDAPLNNKRALDIEVEFYESAGQADITIKLDGKNEQIIAKGLQISTTKKLPLKLPFSLGGKNLTNFKFNLRHLSRFRELQVVVTTYRGRAKVRNININALVMPT